MRQLKLSLLLGLLLWVPSAYAQSVRFQSQAISTRGAGIANATVAVCTQPANTNTQPCSPLATLATSTITTSGGANPLTADSFGNFFFYAAPGRYTVQIYGPAVSGQFVTPDVEIGSVAGGSAGTFSNLTVSGTGTFTGTTVNCRVGITRYVNQANSCAWAGSDIFAQIASAITDCAGPCVVDATNFSANQFPAGSLTISNNATTIIWPSVQVNIAATKQIIISPSTTNVAFQCNTYKSDTAGCLIAYGSGAVGAGPAILVGSSASDTQKFAIKNIRLDISGAATNAVGLQLNRAILYTTDHFECLGIVGTVNTQKCVDLEGTGNSTSGVMYSPVFNGANNGLWFGPAANANTVIQGQWNPSNGGANTGTCINLDGTGTQISGNFIWGGDCEGGATAIVINNAVNTFASLRIENFTNLVNATASSAKNKVYISSGVIVSGTTVTDSGTANDIMNTGRGCVGQPAATTCFDPTGLVFTKMLASGFVQVSNNLLLGAGGTNTKIMDSTGTFFMGFTLKTGSGAGNYTGTNTTYAAVDTTNLCATITVPLGWKLKVETGGVLESVTAAVAQNVALADAGTTCAGGGVTALNGTERNLTPPAAGTFDEQYQTQFVFTGDGAAHSILLVAKTSNAADAWGIQNTSATVAPSLIYTLMPSN